MNNRKDVVAYCILRGNVMRVDGQQQALEIFSNALDLLGKTYDVEALADTLYNKTKATVVYMVANIVESDIHITFLLKDDGVAMPALDDSDGIFAYVCNVSAPYDSSFGYVFFEKREDGKYHRIG